MSDAPTIEAIAEALHEAWRAGGGPKAARLDVPYGALAEADREENRAAARRIAESLAALGVAVAPGRRDAAQAREMAGDIEPLAAAEHEGWRRRRAALGWRFAPSRDDAQKLHPAMVDYALLPESEKEKDRAAVRAYLSAIEAAGLSLR